MQARLDRDEARAALLQECEARIGEQAHEAALQQKLDRMKLALSLAQTNAATLIVENARPEVVRARNKAFLWMHACNASNARASMAQDSCWHDTAFHANLRFCGVRVNSGAHANCRSSSSIRSTGLRKLLRSLPPFVAAHDGVLSRCPELGSVQSLPHTCTPADSFLHASCF